MLPLHHEALYLYVTEALTYLFPAGSLKPCGLLRAIGKRNEKTAPDFLPAQVHCGACPQGEMTAAVRSSIAQIVSAQVEAAGRGEAGAASEARGGRPPRPARPAYLVINGEQNSRKEEQP